MRGPDWLVARPIAHRGLYDPAAGIPENSIAAARAAVEAGYAIEADVRPAADGTAMVFHDAALERMTGAAGRIGEAMPHTLSRLRLAGGDEPIPSLAELLAAIAGRAGLFVEIKSGDGPAASGARAFAHEVARELDAYRGPAAIMSFDPESVRAAGEIAPQVPRGLVSGAHRGEDDRRTLDALTRWRRRHLLAVWETRAHFVAYDSRALPAIAPAIVRLAGVRLLTWTVRGPDEMKRLERHVDQIIFERFRP